MHETIPDRLRGELVGVSFPPDTGETCHVVTGGGVSQELPDADRLRCPPPGGVPIINWTYKLLINISDQKHVRNESSNE